MKPAKTNSAIKFSSLALTAGFLSLPVFGQNSVVFATEFDYPDGIPTIIIPENLNGADEQIGTFSGTPPTDASEASRFITVTNTTGARESDTYLLAEGANQDFTILANFTDPLELNGAVFSFDIGTSRISSDHSLDNQIIGFSTDGEEVFHLWVSAKSTNDPTANDELRLGFEEAGTNDILWDLPFGTGFLAGSDENGDIGFFNGDTDDPSVRLPSSFIIFLSDEGFRVQFIGGVAGGNGSSGGSLSLYSSGRVPFSGSGTNLARIEFRGMGGDSENTQSGFWLDDIEVRGILVPEPVVELEILDYTFDPVSRNGTIRYASMPGVSYSILGSEDLQTWTPLDLFQVTSGSETTAIDVNIPIEVEQRFYQVEEILPEVSE